MSDIRQQISDETVKLTGAAATASDTALVVALSPNSVVPLPSVTKGIQSSIGITTQDLKDSGRVNVAISTYQAAGVATSEGLFASGSFSISRDGGIPVSAQQFSVTPGMRFRIQNICISIGDSIDTTALRSKIVLRYSGVGGVISSSSSVLCMWDLSNAVGRTGNTLNAVSLPLPVVNAVFTDGLELISGSTFGFTNLASNVNEVHTITLIGYEY